ncbi:MAG: L-aspartate oxidase [Xanthomonadales bacterium]|nr:L-aspartate oxidase [Xanthomonadales bacterium]
MHQAPVVIVGSGIAGLWTALHAAPLPVVLLAGNSLGGDSSTGWAQGGIAAALGEDDSPALHAEDTVAAGAGLADEAAAWLLAEAAPDEIRALEDLGVSFDRLADGRWALSREAAHSRARVARVGGDRAGQAILDALTAAARATTHIEIREGWFGRGLLQRGNHGCRGVLAQDTSGNRQEIPARASVVATGGLGGLYATTTNPAGNRGQALAWAARLGAFIRDPEFVQFHPTAIDIGRDPAPLATEALRGDGAVLVDRHGRRFMPDFHPDAELAPRDVVARAVHQQVQSGSGAFLDAVGAVGEQFPGRFPTVFDSCMAAGIDPRVQPIPVAPAEHYHMGGVATDSDGFSEIPGLYVIGEAGCTGVHGANRLASNSLLDALVTGGRAARRIRDTESNLHLARGPAEKPEPALSGRPMRELRQAMTRHAGVERSAEGLESLVELIGAMTAEHGPADALVAARFVAAGALLREESRGAHARVDFPGQTAPVTHTELNLERLEQMLPSERRKRGAA